MTWAYMLGGFIVGFAIVWFTMDRLHKNKMKKRHDKVTSKWDTY